MTPTPIPYTGPERRKNATLRHLMSFLDPYLRQEITELAINEPGRVWLMMVASGDWVPHVDSAVTEEFLRSFCSAVAAHQKQTVNEQKPLLSTTLSSGLRIQIVMPPAVVLGKFVVAIRKPSTLEFDWDYYREKGFFDYLHDDETGLTREDAELLALKKSRRYEEFLRLAILYKKNIVVSGATATGKTTFTNLLLRSIPKDERILTIEDSEELKMPHENQVRLMYSKGKQGVADVTPEDDIEASLRLSPNRTIFAEIRGPETFAFLDAIFTGHDGCITSMHAASPAKAFKRMQLMFKKSEVGRGFDTRDIEALLYTQIDVIIQIKRHGTKRFISEIYFDPELQRRYAAGSLGDTGTASQSKFADAKVEAPCSS
jgi:type IV secretion system protein VirB11